MANVIAKTRFAEAQAWPEQTLLATSSNAIEPSFLVCHTASYDVACSV
jgi:hypothetical protein